MDLARRLTDYLAVAHAFDWCECNCCHFALRWAGAMRGADLMAGLPPTPDSAAARALLRQLGGLPQALGERLGPAIAPALAQPGDIVLIGRSTGICAGRTAAVLSERDGVVHVPMAQASHAWRLGVGA